MLEYKKDVLRLAKVYLELLGLPSRYSDDCKHIAYATYYEIEFLGTCNLTHIANPIHIEKIHSKNIELNLATPIIVTPENLLAFEEGEKNNG